jgi:hypothetical protein
MLPKSLNPISESTIGFPGGFMKKESQLILQLLPASIQAWRDILENIIIACSPNRPSSEYDNLHEERLLNLHFQTMNEALNIMVWR